MGRHRTAIVPIRPQTETQEPKKAEQNQPKLKADTEDNQRKKHKKGKREKRAKSASRGVTEPPVSEGKTLRGHNEETQDAEMLDEETHPKEPKEPKRPKKRKQRDVESEEQPLDSEEEAQRKKHDAIFAKYQKAAEQAEAERANAPPIAEDDPMDVDTPGAAAAPELHDLTPFPLPKQPPEPEYKPNFSALPPWLAKPIFVSSSTTEPFGDIPLSTKLQENLQRKGLKQTLAVQSAVMPLLLPGAKAYNGDICISAATGSGKTLAYMLPMVESLKQKITSRLRGLIVVPTRELVMQARQVAEMCAAGTGLQIGTAVGNVSLSEEQERLIKRGQRYDPAAFKIMYDEACKRVNVDFGEDKELQQDFLTLLPDHIPEFSSKVDILICTPGRLVDHIRKSRGFSLSEVDWLVIDEADRLLDESFQEWVTTLLDALHPKRSDEHKTAREKVLASIRPSQGERRVKKIIMSATMTRDLSKLASLRLKRPALVAVVDDASSNDKDAAETSAYTFELPPMLEEKVIHVGDGKERPLCLWQLIQGHVLRRDPEKNIYEPCNITIRGQKILVFARDNENASRLAYLIKALLGTQAQFVGLLTKSSTKSKEARKTLTSFQRGQIQILIATDRASRGLDFEGVAHVINYDVPYNIAGYIHRVGRTARAGNKGTAWTLVTDVDAGWFLSEIAKSARIRRGGRTAERMKVDMKSVSEETRFAYRAALDGLMDAVTANYVKKSK